MLSLDSPGWAKLKHACGEASDIPGLLRQLESLPSSDGESEPWLRLWRALAHRGKVYPASFAAVPHVVRVLEQDPAQADFSYFRFPVWVEICRQKNCVAIPDHLADPYFDALARLPSLSAMAASRGYASVAAAVMELDAEAAEEFMEWFENQ